MNTLLDAQRDAMNALTEVLRTPASQPDKLTLLREIERHAKRMADQIDWRLTYGESPP